jgi:hypothetical protein
MTTAFFNIKKTFASIKTAQRNLNLYYKGDIRNRLDVRVIEHNGAFAIGHIIPADQLHLVNKNETVIEVRF